MKKHINIKTKIRITLITTIVLVIGGRYLFLKFYTPTNLSLSKVDITVNSNIGKNNISSTINAKQEIIPQVQKELFTPPPLTKLSVGDTTGPNPYTTNSNILDPKGIILLTNIQRQLNGFVPLSENKKLDNSAEIKVDDIFQKQYFEHVSPNGTTIQDLSKESGYDYIMIGENLAMGNFKDNNDLVEAWMASPEHRANILKSRYREIGVSVKEGLFQGNKVWVAVQHFGFSLDSCPKVNSLLKNEIDNQKTSLDIESTNLNSLKASLDNFSDKTSLEYQNMVNNYNAKIKIYSQDAAVLEKEVLDYNNQVKLFNNCILGK